MKTTPNLDDLLSQKSERGAEVAAARRAEQAFRNNRAHNMASSALRRLHHDDFQALMEQAHAKVDAERGPLPGDEVAS